MSLRIVSGGWDDLLADALVADRSHVRVVCPFIKKRAARRLLEHGPVPRMEVITRFNLADFGSRVSDPAALRLLLEAGARIRGVRGLHAKLYLIGDRSIVTSANLTERGLLSNHELGFTAQGGGVTSACRQYFEDLWDQAGPDLTPARIDSWERTLAPYFLGGARSAPTGLGDEGTDVAASEDPLEHAAAFDDAEQAFVKFFGRASERAPLSMRTIEEVERSGSHWACTFPAGSRPRQVRDGAVMFLARLVEPRDIHIYGRALAVEHRPGRDDATPEELDLRPWKKRWPRYVRVHHAEFVAGTLANCVPMSLLMDELGPDAFASTQRNVAAGTGNQNPRRSYLRRPSVELSLEGFGWVNERLQRAFDLHGKLSPSVLEGLDWPELDASEL